MTPSPRPFVNRFRSQLALGGPAPMGLESTPQTRDTLDLSPAHVDERMSALEQEWRTVVGRHLGDDPALHDIVKQIARNGRTALRVLGDEDEERIAGDAHLREQLEVIVLTDGSRPSFMIRQGAVDVTTSPVGAWSDALDTSTGLLSNVIKCVGRIDVPGSFQGFQGTGFLIAENLIVTNRHVLQVIASPESGGSWRLQSGVTIDFGHEFRATETFNRRALKKVLFAGPREIDPTGIDHGRLDLVLIELKEAQPAERLQQYLAVDTGAEWATSQQQVYILGYPGQPQVGAETPSLLEKLFKQTFGCKRLAPGLVTITPTDLPESPRDWSVGHDATTLGGNSGSVVVIVGREQVAAGLHYGGTRSDPRVNWAHVLGPTLDETNGFATTKLREHMRAHDVQLFDVLGGGG